MNSRGTILPWGELFIFLLITFSESEFAVSALFTCMIHEIAHIVVCKIVGGRFRGIRPRGAGLVISYYPANISYGREIAVILAGSCVNLVLGFIFILIGVTEAATVNIAVGLFNLLPMKGLDGGEAVFSVVSYFNGEKIAFKLSRIVSVFCSVILWLIAVYYQLRLGVNLSFLLISVYILIVGLR